MRDTNGKIIEIGFILKCCKDVRFAEKGSCYKVFAWEGISTLICIYYKKIPILLSEFTVENDCLVDFEIYKG